jgi:hypothetical protein
LRSDKERRQVFCVSCCDATLFLEKQKSIFDQVTLTVWVLVVTAWLSAVLRACSQSSEQNSQEGQVDELQAGIELALAVFP